MRSTAIEIKNLSIAMEQQLLFSGLNLSLTPGQKTTLVGKSGCGKSTLLRCLLGFASPDAGTIHIFGKELTRHSVWQLRTHMAYVAQEPELGTGKVLDILEQPFSFKANRHLRGNLDRTPELLEQLHLPGQILDKETSMLSGGERQRIALLSALLLNREILLLDEASSALDQASKLAVIELLKNNEGMTILSVSHDQEWLGFSSDIVELHNNNEVTAV